MTESTPAPMASIATACMSYREILLTVSMGLCGLKEGLPSGDLRIALSSMGDRIWDITSDLKLLAEEEIASLEYKGPK